MTDHQRFTALLDRLGLSYRDLGDRLGMKYTSIKNQLAPGKVLPRWAVGMLITQDLLNKKLDG